MRLLVSARMAARMGIDTLQVYLEDDADGGTLYLTDGDLFGGHSILVDLDWDGVVRADPYLAG